MQPFNSQYWNDRYIKNETGWDLGKVSTPLKKYIDQIKNKNLKILIPGAGNGYEAAYLWEKGFYNLYIIDIAPKPLIEFKEKHNYFPDNQIILGDFFDLLDTFDLILEQTFFCALSPSLRTAYANKCSSILNENGKIAGVLFNFDLTDKGPPFGGSYHEYTALFKKHFKINTMEPCYNSEPSRHEKELFFIVQKK